MKILDLSLTYHWYDEIESGNKPEEYRKQTPFYKRRLMTGYNEFLCTCHCITCPKRKQGLCRPRDYDAIRFHRGQGSRRTMLVKFNYLCFGFGNTEWGSPIDEEVFIIKLGDKIR